ncbi:MAG TPA: hypothetical protein VI685_29510, partial [Candidatus Angelobacter sp.]
TDGVEAWTKRVEEQICKLIQESTNVRSRFEANKLYLSKHLASEVEEVISKLDKPICIVGVADSRAQSAEEILSTRRATLQSWESEGRPGLWQIMSSLDCEFRQLLGSQPSSQ